MTTTSQTPSDVGKVPPRWLMKTATRVHVLLHRLSGRLNTLGGDEVCFVSMTRAKSGRRLTIPLMYVPHSQGVLLVASQGGAPRNPAWYHNLVRHPEIEVEHRGRRIQLRARLAESAEKDALWETCDRHYAPYAEYRQRTTRDIPIFVCEPR